MSDGGLPAAGKKYQEHAENLDKEVSIVRDVILYGFATKRNIEGTSSRVAVSESAAQEATLLSDRAAELLTTR